MPDDPSGYISRKTRNVTNGQKGFAGAVRGLPEQLLLACLITDFAEQPAPHVCQGLLIVFGGAFKFAIRKGIRVWPEHRRLHCSEAPSNPADLMLGPPFRADRAHQACKPIGK